MCVFVLLPHLSLHRDIPSLKDHTGLSLLFCVFRVCVDTHDTYENWEDPCSALLVVTVLLRVALSFLPLCP